MTLDKENELRKLRKTYILERRLHEQQRTGCELGNLEIRDNPFWDGGIDRYGKHHKPVWPRLLSFANANSLDPSTLIRAVFFCWNKGTVAPTPTQCVGDKALLSYAAYKAAAGDNLRSRFDFCRKQARLECWKIKCDNPDLRDGEVWRRVVVSPLLQAGALFRYCLACHTGQSDLADVYRKDAALEYIRFVDEYNKFLRQQLPKTFILEAEAMHKKLTGDK